jgi:hypothetical protein
MFYSLQGMSSDRPEVLELLKVLTGLLMTCKEDLSANKAGNMFLGMKNLKGDKPEVLELLNVMTDLTKKCEQREPLSAKVAENMILGMQGLSDKVKMMVNEKSK